MAPLPQALSALGVLVASFIREPDDTRYLYPATIAVLAILVEALAGRRLPSRTVIGLYVVVAVSAAANILQLTNLSDFQRANSTPGLRAALGVGAIHLPAAPALGIAAAVIVGLALTVLWLRRRGRTRDGGPHSQRPPAG